MWILWERGHKEMFSLPRRVVLSQVLTDSELSLKAKLRAVLTHA